MNTRTESAPAMVRRTPYDRHEWEEMVLTTAFHPTTRQVALTLAHYAGPGGHLPDGGIQHTGRMAERTGLGAERVRNNMRALERAGFLWRPDRDPAHGARVRPITLTMPAPRARGELPSTGEVPE